MNEKTHSTTFDCLPKTNLITIRPNSTYMNRPQINRHIIPRQTDGFVYSQVLCYDLAIPFYLENINRVITKIIER